jgi:hypothetical protein
VRDPGLGELELALAQFCDKIVSDFTFPTREGMRRQVQWRYRGKEFRATVLMPQAGEELSPLRYAQWRVRGRQFDQLPSRPVFEFQEGPFDWRTASNVQIWRWALLPAGHRGLDDGDELPGDLTGRPVRPRPGLPSLSAGAVAIPEPAEREVPYHPVAALSRRGADDDELGRVPRWR